MFRLILAALVVTIAAAVPRAAADSREAADEGIAWMHSFEYERALELFVKAEREDPLNAMAYWGQAMCYEQLLWGNENVEEARKILARLKRSGALDRADDRQKGWVATAEVLFGEGDRPTRLAAYAAAMARLAASYPDDPDVAVFHGLATMAGRSRGLAGAHPSTHADGSLAGSAEQAQAAQIFTRVLKTNPKHPGALHYLIHAYDDPANAPKALDAARVYATLVPESSHARHMPAHVFVQLGMWDEAIASDEAAAAAADARVAQDRLPAKATDFHPLSWLVYEYTQANRFADARRARQRLQMTADATRDPRLLSLVASLRSRIAIEDRNWNAVAGPDFVNYDELFAVGFSAAHRQDTVLAERARVRLAEMAAQPRYADRAALLEIMSMQVGAAMRATSGDLEGALMVMRDATARERALPASIGPPALLKPAQEHYAELLVQTQRYKEAIAQYDGVLARMANRRLSVEGRRRAVTASGTRSMVAWPVGGGLLTVVVAVVALRRRRSRAA